MSLLFTSLSASNQPHIHKDSWIPRASQVTHFSWRWTATQFLIPSPVISISCFPSSQWLRYRDCGCGSRGAAVSCDGLYRHWSNAVLVTHPFLKPLFHYSTATGYIPPTKPHWYGIKTPRRAIYKGLQLTPTCTSSYPGRHTHTHTHTHTGRYNPWGIFNTRKLRQNKESRKGKTNSRRKRGKIKRPQISGRWDKQNYGVWRCYKNIWDWKSK